jgi:hypothetical protein
MNFVVDGTVAALVAIIVQMLAKPLIEVWLKPTAPNHDTVIRAVALLLGVVLLAVTTLIGGPWPATGNAWLLLFGSGAMSGLAAIGGYHALTGSASPSPLAGTFVTGETIIAPLAAPAPIEHVLTVKVAQPDQKLIDVAPPAVGAGEAATEKTP